MVRTQIQLTEHQVKGVKALARAEGISAAEVIRRAIDELIQSKPMLDQCGQAGACNESRWPVSLRAVGHL